MKKRAAIPAAVCAALLTAAVILLMKLREPVAPSVPQTRVTEPAGPEEIAADDSPGAPDALEVETLIDDALGEAIVQAQRKMDEAARAPMSAAEKEAARRAAEDAAFDLFVEAFYKLTPYNDVREDLKHGVIREYGAVTPSNIAGLVEQSRRLADEFWAAGDFTDLDSFTHIYKARAILECCVEAFPQNEPALAQLCEILRAGWPTIHREDPDPAVNMESFRRCRDVNSVLMQLWEGCLSRRELQNAQDAFHAYDLLTNTMHLQRYLRKLEKLPDPSVEGATSPFPDDILSAREVIPAPSTKAAVARWAEQGARSQGVHWKEYASYFEQYLAMGLHENSTAGFFSVLHRDETRYESLTEKYRLWRWRMSYQGPPKRRAALVPAHIFAQRPVPTPEQMAAERLRKAREARLESSR